MDTSKMTFDELVDAGLSHSDVPLDPAAGTRLYLRRLREELTYLQSRASDALGQLDGNTVPTEADLKGIAAAAVKAAVAREAFDINVRALAVGMEDVEGAE